MKKLLISFLAFFLFFPLSRVNASYFTWSPSLYGYSGNMVSSLPSAQEWYFYFSCGTNPMSTTTPMPVLAIGRDSTVGTLEFERSYCPTQINLIGIGVKNLDDITPLDPTMRYLWDLRYQVNAEFNWSQESPWVITQSSMVPRTLNHDGWATQGWNGSHLQYGFDMDIQELSQTAYWSQEYNGGLRFRRSSQVYELEYIGGMYEAPDSFKSTAPNIMLGNAVPGIWTVSPLLSFQVPNSESSETLQISFSKGSVTIIPEDQLTSGEQQIVNSIDAQTAEIENQTQVQQQIAAQQEAAAQARQDQIMDSDTSQGETAISDFITSFDDGSDPSLSGVITKPLEFIRQLTTTTCTPLLLPLPFDLGDLNLPCGRSMISSFASPLLSLWDTISVGFIAYWIATNLFRKIHEFKNPDNDGNVEVLEL